MKTAIIILSFFVSIGILADEKNKYSNAIDYMNKTPIRNEVYSYFKIKSGKKAQGYNIFNGLVRMHSGIKKNDSITSFLNCSSDSVNSLYESNSELSSIDFSALKPDTSNNLMAYFSLINCNTLMLHVYRLEDKTKSEFYCSPKWKNRVITVLFTFDENDQITKVRLRKTTLNRECRTKFE